MNRRFNISGLCYPDKHYMVRLDERLFRIKVMMDYSDYFVISRKGDTCRAISFAQQAMC